MRKFQLILILMVGVMPVMGQQTLSLAQCIELAWKNNLEVRQSKMSMEAAEYDLNGLRANTLPNVNGFASHNYNWGQRIDPFTNQFATTRVQSNSFGLSSSLTLFNGLQNYRDIQAGEAALASASYDLETQKNNIALAVASAFLQVLFIDELIESAEQQVAISSNQLERVKKLVEAGASNMGVQYELEAQYSRDRSTLIQHRNDYQLAELQLKQIMLLPAEESLSLIRPEISADSAQRLENAATVYAYANTNMPEIKRAEYSLLQREKQLESSRSGYYPSLTLSGSIGTGYSGLRTNVESVSLEGEEPIGYTESGEVVYTPIYNPVLVKVPFGTQLNDNFNQFIGLSLNVPIFNRNSVRTNVRRTEINRSIAELQLEQEKLALRQRIEAARADAVAAGQLYRASLDALKSAQKAFEFAELRFENGAINAMEFNNSKNNLQLAQAQLAGSLYDFVFKSKVLDFYMGKPLGFNE